MHYTFTPDELRLVQSAQLKLNQTLSFILELHQINQPVGLSGDGRGFVLTQPMVESPVEIPTCE